MNLISMDQTRQRWSWGIARKQRHSQGFGAYGTWHGMQLPRKLMEHTTGCPTGYRECMCAPCAGAPTLIAPSLAEQLSWEQRAHVHSSCSTLWSWLGTSILCRLPKVGKSLELGCSWPPSQSCSWHESPHPLWTLRHCWQVIVKKTKQLWIWSWTHHISFISYHTYHTYQISLTFHIKIEIN